MVMNNPPHPGISVKINCLDPLELNITEAADALGVSRVTLSRVINGRSSISPEMAIRLAKAFGSTPEVWLRMQFAYDLAQARKKEKQIHIRRYPVKHSVSHRKPATT